MGAFFPIAVLIALLVLPTPSAAELHVPGSFPLAANAFTAESIVDRLRQSNRELETYQAHVRLEFCLRSFPYFREHLDGTASFQRPSRYQLDLQRVPSYAKGFSRLSAELADPGSWERKYVVSFVGLRGVDGRQDVVLRLVQRVRGQIDHQDVVVNPIYWEVDAMEYHYYNGGTIAMRQRFESIGRFRLIASQDAQIRIPYVKAIAHAEYTDYHTNIALGDHDH
jgi:hypothetical protein